ncbi:EthD domain-containing protein [Trichoderma novae-zelandiae]
MSSTLYLIAFIKRRPDLTQEQFYHHWRNVHAPKIAYWAKKHGITGYTQVHTSSALGESLTATPLPVAVMDFDGAVVWEFSSLEHYMSAFADPYYVNVIAPDEDNFLDKSKGTATVALGNIHHIVAGGEALIDFSQETESLNAE